MDEKLLEIIKLADLLNEKQDKLYAHITYTADDYKSLEITIYSKETLTYVDSIETNLDGNSIISIDDLISLFKGYIGSVINGK